MPAGAGEAPPLLTLAAIEARATVREVNLGEYLAHVRVVPGDVFTTYWPDLMAAPPAERPPRMLALFLCTPDGTPAWPYSAESFDALAKLPPGHKGRLIEAGNQVNGFMDGPDPNAPGPGGNSSAT